MSAAYKRLLSGSTSRKGIKVAAVATAGTLIHTAVAGTTAGTYDEIWLYAYNGNTSSTTLTIEWGGVAVPDDNITVTLAAKSGLIPIVPGLLLQNGLVIRAFADVANVVVITGFVNSITD